MAAKSKKLGQIHERFAEYILFLMDQAQTPDDDGNYERLPAAELAVIRAFLKDNNVTADPDASNDVKEVANSAKAAMQAAGIDTAEIDRIAEDFANFTGGLHN